MDLELIGARLNGTDLFEKTSEHQAYKALLDHVIASTVIEDNLLLDRRQQYRLSKRFSTRFIFHRPLRILFATEYLPPFVSGISNRCKNWINGYRADGHVVTVCSVNGAECELVCPSIANPFYEHQRAALLPPLGLLLELLNPLVEPKYDICHVVAPMNVAFVPLVPLMWLRGIKVYISYHVYLEYYLEYYVNHILGPFPAIFSVIFTVVSTFLFPLLYFIPLAFFADCVGIPSKTADFYIFEYSQRVHILKSGLDTNIFHPDAGIVLAEPNLTKSMGIQSLVGESDHSIKDLRVLAGPDSNLGPILIYTGRIALEKSIHFLIQAMDNPLMVNATLVIVGDGPLRSSLETLAIKTVGKEFVYSVDLENGTENLRNKVIFTGMILDERKVASFYAQSDIFVSASGSETFGFTVAEAMACSTPAVVVKSGAFPAVYKMILENMFETDDIQGYCNCVCKVYEDINRLSESARKIAVSGFSIESSVKDLLQVYYHIIDGCPDKSDDLKI